MKIIKLTQNKIAIVDDDDYKLLSKFTWCAHRNKKKNYDDTWYAATNIRIDGKYKTIHMHRMIMNTPTGKDVDHIDRNGLNNQRNNLRSCTRSENLMNQRKYKGLSKYKGVGYHKKGKKWVVHLDKKYLGLYDNEKEAAKVYNNYAIKLFGNFARVNLIN